MLQNLLRERIPIRNLLLILESLADAARVSKDIDFLTERVRAAMARHICAEYAEDGLLSVITVDPRLESLFGRGGAPRRGRVRAARSKYGREDLLRRSPDKCRRRSRRDCTHRAVLAVRASGAQASYRARRAATGRALVLARSRPACASSRSDRFQPPRTHEPLETASVILRHRSSATGSAQTVAAG